MRFIVGLLLVVCALTAVPASADAQSARPRLDGLLKLSFGTDIAAARTALGSGQTEGQWVSADKSVRLKLITHHDRALIIGGKSHFITYYFDAGDRMIAAAFTSKFEAKEEDEIKACYDASSVMRELEARYGRPDRQEDRDGDLYFFFAFADGGEIEAALSSEDFDCELRVALRDAAGKKIRIFD